MNKAQLIESIDNLFRSICFAHKEYHIFRVGSSLFHESIPIQDIDYFLIDENSNKDYGSQIRKLKSEFSGIGFLNAAIDTLDLDLNLEISKFETLVNAQSRYRLEHVFGFGPIPMPKGENIVVLHLAGPMNQLSTNTFFLHFPLFHLLWSKYHVQLGTKPLHSIVERPSCTDEDISQGFKEIYARAKAVDSEIIHRQCLKRLKLVELAMNNHPSPYIESFQQTSNLKYDEVLVEIQKYSNYFVEY